MKESMNSKEMGLGSLKSKQRGTSTASFLWKVRTFDWCYSYVSFSSALYIFLFLYISRTEDCIRIWNLVRRSKGSIWTLPLWTQEGFPGGTIIMSNRIHPPIQETQEMRIQSLGQEDPQEKEMATHSSILVREVPWTEEPGGLQSMGLEGVRHDWAHMHTRHNTHIKNLIDNLEAVTGRSVQETVPMKDMSIPESIFT